MNLLDKILMEREFGYGFRIGSKVLIKAEIVSEIILDDFVNSETQVCEPKSFYRVYSHESNRHYWMEKPAEPIIENVFEKRYLYYEGTIEGYTKMSNGVKGLECSNPNLVYFNPEIYKNKPLPTDKKGNPVKVTASVGLGDVSKKMYYTPSNLTQESYSNITSMPLVSKIGRSQNEPSPYLDNFCFVNKEPKLTKDGYCVQVNEYLYMGNMSTSLKNTRTISWEGFLKMYKCCSKEEIAYANPDTPFAKDFERDKGYDIYHFVEPEEIFLEDDFEENYSLE